MVDKSLSHSVTVGASVPFSFLSVTKVSTLSKLKTVDISTSDIRARGDVFSLNELFGTSSSGK